MVQSKNAHKIGPEPYEILLFDVLFVCINARFFLVFGVKCYDFYCWQQVLLCSLNEQVIASKKTVFSKLI